MSKVLRATARRHKREAALRLTLAASLLAVIGGLGVAPAEAAGGGRYTYLTGDSNGTITVEGYGSDGTLLRRIFSPTGRTDAEGYVRVSKVYISNRTTMKMTCWHADGTRDSYFADNPSTTGFLDVEFPACQGNERMELRVRVM